VVYRKCHDVCLGSIRKLSFCFLATFVGEFGKYLPQSTNGANVMTMPAAAVNFRKSRPATRGLLLVEPPRLI
jgi:hypothetical protein